MLPPGVFPVLPARELLSRRRAQVGRIKALAGTTRPHFERALTRYLHG